MKKLNGMFVSAAMLLAAQTSMAYTGEVRLNGFSSEVDALNASKQTVQQFADGTRQIAFSELSDICVNSIEADPKVVDVQIEKKYKIVGSALTETFEAVVNYQYDCEALSSL